jgi:uncharacterized protein (TIGR02118 family)
MIKVAFFYPSDEGNSFDHEYFLNHHMPLVADRLGEALLAYEAEAGLDSTDGSDAQPYLAAVHMSFESKAAFDDAFAPVSEELVSDIPKYTNATPVMQISEVRGRYVAG